MSDVNLLFTEHFYYDWLFLAVAISLLMTSLMFPCVMVSRGLYPSKTRKIYEWFPGYIFISRHLFFITTDSRGVIAIKEQKIFSPKTLEQLHELDEADLKRMLVSQGDAEKKVFDRDVSMNALAGKTKEELMEY